MDLGTQHRFPSKFGLSGSQGWILLEQLPSDPQRKEPFHKRMRIKAFKISWILCLPAQSSF